MLICQNFLFYFVFSSKKLDSIFFFFSLNERTKNAHTANKRKVKKMLILENLGGKSRDSPDEIIWNEFT